MASNTYRGNLSAAQFPMLSSLQGRTVIIPGADNTFNRQVASQQQKDRDVGIPQIYYCENVLPMSYGYISVGEAALVSPAVGYTGYFTQCELIYDASGNSRHVAVTTTGEVWVRDASTDSAAWAKILSAESTIKIFFLTIANIDGRSFVVISNKGRYEYNYTTSTLPAVTLTGLESIAIGGVANAAGTLIAWDLQTVYWSALENPTDFVESLLTGAGFGAVVQAKGVIKTCVPHALGFHIYTERNVVTALATGKSDYPYTLREVVNSGGILDTLAIATNTNSTVQYSFTTSGLQSINTTNADSSFYEQSDFLSGKRWESWDNVNKKVILHTESAVLKKRLSVVGDRYLVIAYGPAALDSLNQFALVYDLAEQRWGKIRCNGLQALEATIGSNYLFNIFKQDGSISGVTSSPGNTNGLIVLGKYQHVRTRFLQLNKISIDNLLSYTSAPDVFVIPTLDGATPYNPQKLSYNDYAVGNCAVTYLCVLVGMNISVVISGEFELASIILEYSLHGRA
jgi:hypothetical protein